MLHISICISIGVVLITLPLSSILIMSDLEKSIPHRTNWLWPRERGERREPGRNLYKIHTSYCGPRGQKQSLLEISLKFTGRARETLCLVQVPTEAADPSARQHRWRESSPQPAQTQTVTEGLVRMPPPPHSTIAQALSSEEAHGGSALLSLPLGQNKHEERRGRLSPRPTSPGVRTPGAQWKPWRATGAPAVGVRSSGSTAAGSSTA